MTTTSSANSGTSALTGFDYQRRVSVLAALDIVAASRSAKQIMLEPVTEEDLEAEITDEVDAAVGSIVMPGYQLVIQCKRRTTGPFDVAAMRSLLGHGVVRTKPKDRLNNPAVRYLLVTNADLAGTARELQMKKFNDWPDTIPASLSTELGVTAPRRIGVLNVLDDEKLNGRIERFLAERFKVPTAKLVSCIDALANAALDRMLGQNGGVWLRAEIEQTVRQFGGFTGTSEALDGYVQPTNRNQLKAQLSQNHALVLIGASGTGKTRTARALLADLQGSIAGLDVRHITGGPESIPSDTRGTSIAFEIEDPWGRYRLSPSAMPWNDRLPELLRTARADRYFVVTSRSDILNHAKPRDLHDRWIARLEEEHYGDAQRSQLYENRYDQMSREVQTALTGHKRTAMEQLATPLEMERFFANLINGRDSDESAPEFVHRCLKDARETSIELALVNGVRVREDWTLAAIVWGLFQAQPRLTFELTPAIQSGLSDRDSQLEDTLEPFLHFLIAGRNLRQIESTLSLQHPRVEQGLESAMKEKPDRSRRSLRNLVLTLIDIDALANSDWGREGAARIIGAAAEAGFKLTLPAPEQGQLDAWLESHLSSEGLDEERLKLAAAAGSATSDLSELARWLIHSPREGRSWESFIHWDPPVRDDAWYQRIGANPTARALCERFVTRLLPLRYLEYPDDFHVHLAKFGYDLRIAFRDAAVNIVGSSGYNSNDEAVLNGALLDIALFEDVVSAAADHERSDKSIDEELQLRLLNGELNHGAYEHYSESAGDNTVTSSAFLRRYVREMRKSGLVEDYYLTEEKDSVESVFSTVGFSLGGSGENSAMAFVKLRAFDERKSESQSASAVAGRAFMYFQKIRDAQVFALAPPAIQGLGSSGGFEMVLLDNAGAGSEALNRASNQLAELAGQTTEVTNVRGNAGELATQLKIVIDQEKAGALGVDLSAANALLGTALAGTTVNDFDLDGELKPVIVKGDAEFRMQPDDLKTWYARNRSGEMVPFSAFSHTEWVQGSASLSRFNGIPSITLSGSSGAGVSSGAAMDKMEQLTAELGGGYTAGWTGLSYQERLSGSQALFLYAASLVVVFLCLAALYESWSIPLSVLLAVPVGVFGALMAAWLFGQSNDVYFKVGLLTTMGLTAKNAILIVEYARDLRAQGLTLLQSVLDAARIRLRPIAMTSIAFLLGVLPLAIATGAGSGAQNSVGIGVVGGTLAGTLIGIFFVPLFFVLISGGLRIRAEKTA